MKDDLVHLRTEMAWLRHDVRLFTAMSNADVRWFSGSKSLQFYSAKGVLDSVLMAIRRLNDAGRTRAGRLEPGLESLHANLVRNGQAALADQLRDTNQHQQLRHLADKRIAHAKPAELIGESEYYPGLGKGDLHLAMVAQLVDEMSSAYTMYIEPGIHLDLLDFDEDPWDRAIRKRGLPVVDFPPLEIFVNFEDLAPNLRHEHLRRAAEEAVRADPASYFRAAGLRGEAPPPRKRGR